MEMTQNSGLRKCENGKVGGSTGNDLVEEHN
jgi:hypothetical protein